MLGKLMESKSALSLLGPKVIKAHDLNYESWPPTLILSNPFGLGLTPQDENKILKKTLQSEVKKDTDDLAIKTQWDRTTLCRVYYKMYFPFLFSFLFVVLQKLKIKYSMVRYINKGVDFFTTRLSTYTPSLCWKLHVIVKKIEYKWENRHS